MGADRRPAARTIEAVERAVAVLDALAAGGELGTNELARRIGVHPSSVSRLLATLEQGGLVSYVPATGRYRLGARLAELGQAALAGIDLRDVARPHLRALVRETGETATLSVPGAYDAITVDFVQSPHTVASVAQLGRPSVGHATATGKVMLAFTDAQPAEPLERFTEATVVDPGRLAAVLRLVRERGWAEAREEREPGLAAVAVPVLAGDGELVAVLGLQGPAERFGARAARAAVRQLLHHAAAIRDGLGA